MFLEKFLNAMARHLPSKGLSTDALSKLNPDKIYVENVRSLLGVSHSNAVEILEDGLKQGLLRRGVEVMCPDGAVAASAETENELPQTVTCWTEEDGHPEEVQLSTDSLRKVRFYKLNDRPTSIAVGQAT
jgi:hypothetical protein